MIEPGMVLETDGIVPLRFIVMSIEQPMKQGDTYLYCTARDQFVLVDIQEFIEVENATPMKMTIQVIEDEINYRAGSVAELAHEIYIDDKSGAEIL